MDKLGRVFENARITRASGLAPSKEFGVAMVAAPLRRGMAFEIENYPAKFVCRAPRDWP